MSRVDHAFRVTLVVHHFDRKLARAQISARLNEWLHESKEGEDGTLLFWNMTAEDTDEPMTVH